MDPKRTAVVLIEYQNDFTSEGGTLHQAVKPVMDSTNMLANTVETVEKARALGATIVFAPITFTEDYHELSPEPYGILKGVVDSKSFRKGTWGAEIVDVLKPQSADIVIEGKRGLCGFASTNLDFVLRNRRGHPPSWLTPTRASRPAQWPSASQDRVRPRRRVRSSEAAGAIRNEVDHLKRRGRGDDGNRVSEGTWHIPPRQSATGRFHFDRRRYARS
jgi:Isochorismatase family